MSHRLTGTVFSRVRRKRRRGHGEGGQQGGRKMLQRKVGRWVVSREDVDLRVPCGPG